MKPRFRLASLAIILALITLPMTAQATPMGSGQLTTHILQTSTDWIAGISSWWKGLVAGAGDPALAPASPDKRGGKKQAATSSSSSSSTTTEEDDGGTGATTDPDGRTGGGGGF